MPEEPHLYTYLTGPEYLQLIGRLRQIPDAVLEKEIDQFLELLGIYDDRYQTLSSYSKGMRQKILIAAAVLHNPRGTIAVLELIGRRRALEWTMQPDVEFGDDPDSLTVLNLGQVEARAVPNL